MTKNANDIGITKLRAIFKATDEASKSILKSFPYNKMNIAFCQGLKVLLKEKFGSDIELDRDEKFACIHGSYKRAKFEIKTWNGIVLTIADERRAKVIEVFKPIFNEIIGAHPICSYDYHSITQEVYPTIEWSLNPNDRLYELVNMPENYYGSYKENFQDFYTTSIINSLGEQLLTQEGYNSIFESEKNNIKFHFYKKRLIQELRPDIDSDTLHNWIDSCQAYNEMNKQLVKV